MFPVFLSKHQQYVLKKKDKPANQTDMCIYTYTTQRDTNMDKMKALDIA